MGPPVPRRLHLAIPSLVALGVAGGLVLFGTASDPAPVPVEVEPPRAPEPTRVPRSPDDARALAAADALDAALEAGLPRDPVEAGALADRVPAMAPLETWLAAGGLPSTLGPEARARLASVDARFERSGFPRPLAPLLTLRAAPDTLPVPDLGASRQELLGTEVSGWAATAVAAAARVEELYPAAADEVRRGEAASVLGLGGGDARPAFLARWSLPSARAVESPRLAAVLLAYAELIAASYRAVRAPGAARDELALALSHLVGRRGVLFQTSLATRPLGPFSAGRPAHPAGSLFHARVLAPRTRARRLAGLDVSEDQAEMRAAFEAALAPEGEGPVADMRRYLALQELLRDLVAAGADAEVVRIHREHASLFQPQAEAHVAPLFRATMFLAQAWLRMDPRWLPGRAELGNVAAILETGLIDDAARRAEGADLATRLRAHASGRRARR